MLSRVDGLSSAPEIASATGLSEPRVEETLRRLEQVGAVQYERSIELEEDVEIPLDRRRTILEMFQRLEERNHYELLGLDRGCERQDIRSAYYRVVNLVHPDRYYGKRLGSYAPKLDRLFERITIAYDVLSRESTRTCYDDELRQRELAPRVDRRVDAGRVLIATKRQEQAFGPSVVPPAPEPAERAQGVVSDEAPDGPLERAAPPLPGSKATAQARALARRLAAAQAARRSLPPGRGEAPAQQELKEQASDNLKRLYGQRLGRPGDQQLQRYLGAARRALADADPVSALNMLKIAASLVPNNAELHEQVRLTEQQALVAMADTYAQQARSEERDGHLVRAADHYEKAAEGRGSAELFDRAANCLLEGGGDLHRAGEVARRAVALAPEQAAYRLTLSRIYAAAGMRKSAIGEIERALTLAPENPEIRAWLKQVKREKV